MSFCCEKFAEHAGQLQATSALGVANTWGRPTAQFEPSNDGTWNINGCCGGGCYVVTHMNFCPFCGSALGKKTNEKTN